MGACYKVFVKCDETSGVKRHPNCEGEVILIGSYPVTRVMVIRKIRLMGWSVTQMLDGLWVYHCSKCRRR